MKGGIGFFLGFASAIAVVAAPAQRIVEPNLTGIVYVGGTARALLELPGRSGSILRPILQKGQTVAGHTVKEIDVAGGRVELSHTNQLEYSLRLPVESEQLPTFNFRGASLWQVLDIYQEMTGRTVIRSPELPDSITDWISTSLPSTEAATTALAEMISRKRLTLQPVSEKFVFVFHEGDDPLRTVREPPPPAPDDETFPPGLMRFTEAGVYQVLEVYVEMTPRILIRHSGLRGKVSLRTQTALTRSESVWLLEAALLMAGVHLIPEGDSFVFALPRPQPLPRFDSEPGLKNPDDLVPLELSGFGAAELLASYAALVDRKPASDGVPATRLSVLLRSPKPVSRAQAVFALRAIAGIHGFRFVTVGEEQVQLVRAE